MFLTVKKISKNSRTCYKSEALKITIIFYFKYNFCFWIIFHKKKISETIISKKRYNSLLIRYKTQLLQLLSRSQLEPWNWHYHLLYYSPIEPHVSSIYLALQGSQEQKAAQDGFINSNHEVYGATNSSSPWRTPLLKQWSLQSTMKTSDTPFSWIHDKILLSFTS